MIRFTIARGTLQEALDVLVAGIPSKTTLPVLANVMLEVRVGGTRLSATDLDTAMVVDVAADVESRGVITVPAKKLSELVRTLPPAPVRIAEVSGHRVTLDCGRSHCKLLGLPGDEFPALPVVRFQQSWRIRSADLRTLIARTACAASTEDSRPILNGVLWELESDAMRMVATNGHRLAKMDLPAESRGASASGFIVPAKAFDRIRKVFSEDDELEIAKGEKHLVFRSPITAVYTRLIEGPYPPYAQAIPSENDRVAIADRCALIAALRRMSIIASDQTRRVRLSFNAGMLKLSVATPDMGEANDDVAIRFAGDPLDIAFNADYLLDALHHIPSDEVRVSIKTAERAAICEPEAPEGVGSYLGLVMPVRLLD